MHHSRGHSMIPFRFRRCLIISFLLIWMCIAIISLQGVEGRIITVARDGADFSSIQRAINYAEDGDTVRVRNGSYFENIEIDKSIIMEGEGPGVTKIDSLGSGHVVSITADNVTFKGFKVTGGGVPGFAGVYLESRYNSIRDNNVTDNPFGITLISSNYNEIINNTCRSSAGKGILLDRSSYNTISWNNCTLNRDGIFLYHSYYNTLANNSCFRNEMGIELYRSDSNIADNNSCTNNSYYGINPLSSKFNLLVNNYLRFNHLTGIRMSEIILNVFFGNDRDQDSILDEADSFPDDPVASVDSDRDGYPDTWNPNMNPGEFLHNLSIDAFPTDPAASRDTDGDTYPDFWTSVCNMPVI